MQRKLIRLALPALIAVLFCGPAMAQVRLGVDVGALRIRIAPDAPPAPREERRTPRPSSQHVWVGGYWDRQGDRWDWAPGRWEKPSERGSRWIRPQYHNEGGATRYDPGHWSHQKVEEGDDYKNWRKDHPKGH